LCLRVFSSSSLIPAARAPASIARCLVWVAQQIVGPERRGRVSHQAWCGDDCVNSRRPVNSDVGHR
jgi:hypothetical protein